MSQSFKATKELPASGQRLIPQPDARGVLLDVPAHEERPVVEVWRYEIATYQAQLKQLHEDDVDVEGILSWIAGVRSRLIEMRSQALDMRGSDSQRLRNNHLDPFMTELVEQHALASRRLSYMEIEFKMNGPRSMT